MVGPGPGSARQTDGHDEVPVVVTGAGHEPGPERADELEVHLLVVDALDTVPQEAGVEADLERLAAEVAGDGLAPLAHLLRGGRDGDLTRLEAQPDGRVAVREQLDAAEDAGELRAVEDDVVLEG